jgi:hypothetical protein
MKKLWILPIILMAAIAGGVFGLRSCQRAGWEASLFGPYGGSPFAGALTNPPTSTLSIPSHGRLEVYELASEIVPVLVFRSQQGDVQWSRLLLPERRLDDGSVKRAGVRQMRLVRLERDSHGFEVLLTCDWDWGGMEGGLLDLDNNYGFKSFRISW